MTAAVDPSVPPAAALEGVGVDFTVRHGVKLRAVRAVDLALHRGETLALVGESGSGKSTLARVIVRAITPTAGRVLLDGRDITHLPERRLRTLRPRMQMVFQDPFASLDPRMSVGDIIAEPLRVHRRGNRREISERVEHLLTRVGLPADARGRYPNQFSGGQRQRVSIARALALEPQVLVADEPVSALDVSIQAQIVALLDDIRAEYGLTVLVIAHDLALVQHISDRVAVMYLGELVEVGVADDVVFDPQHPYTASLLSATPVPNPLVERERERIVLGGDPPSPIDPPPGCSFHPRCPIARDRCATDKPPLSLRGDRLVACHYPGELPPVLT